MLENLLEYYMKSNGATHTRVPGCNSAKKLVFFKNKVATLCKKV